MHSFLNNIADAYIADPDFYASTFVFPNVRSKRYFTERLVSLGADEHKAKSLCLTLTELMEKGSGRTRASQERLLFTLYRAYRDVTESFGPKGPKVYEFDRFRFWGQTILKDFSDVDSYMAEPEEVFRNVTDLKKIRTPYLTDRQRQIIENYWGEDPFWSNVSPGPDAGTHFWSHINHEGETQRKFMRLWAILAPVYKRFHELLGHYSYSGMAARIVAEKMLRGEPLTPFNPRRFVFIGFNRLTTTETIIFEELNKAGRAHFYWDYDASLMAHAGNPAARFISKYSRRFTACLPSVKPAERPSERKVDVIGVPSSVGQAKVAAGILSREESALVLPSDDMLLPMVASIPEQFRRINVTMGYPLRYSAFSQLFGILENLQTHSTRSEFMRKDVRAVITNPLVQAAFGEECRFVDDYMRRKSLFKLPYGEITDGFGPLRTLFAPLGTAPSLEELTGYVTSVLSLARESQLVTGMDAKCCEIIERMVTQISSLAGEFGVELNRRSFFRLITHALFQSTLPLEGESFEALQVMGVLETRAMGFRHVVMLSMTDSVFPGRDTSTSFIPELLRHAYGLPTREHRDADQAYHFYHILSAADHLTLIYDARSGGLRSGDVSRFISQLRYLRFPSVKLNMHLASFSGMLPSPAIPALAEGAVLPKSPRIMEKLNRYLNPAEKKHYSLSASSLKDYLNCPLAFFLEKVEGLKIPDPETESMNAAELGDIIHEAADRIYSCLKRENARVITREMLSTLLSGGYDGLLENELTRAINLRLYKLPPKVDGRPNADLFTHPITGEAESYQSLLRTLLRHIFEADILSTPFSIVATELSDTFAWALPSGLSVNFTMKIDRLDIITGPSGRRMLRVVDYKTGSEETSFTSVDSLLSIGNSKRAKGIFQLFTYSAAFAFRHHGRIPPEAILPQIFTLKDTGCSAFPPITHKSGPLTSYGEVHEEFLRKLDTTLSTLFNPDEPIARTADARCCKYCKLYEICRGEAPRKSAY